MFSLCGKMGDKVPTGVTNLDMYASQLQKMRVLEEKEKHARKHYYPSNG